MAILANLLMELDGVLHLSFLARAPSSAALSCSLALSVFQQMSLLRALSVVKLKNSRHLEYSFLKKKTALGYLGILLLPPTNLSPCMYQ